jgi:hypothetical protein
LRQITRNRQRYDHGSRSSADTKRHAARGRVPSNLDRLGQALNR